MEQTLVGRASPLKIQYYIVEHIVNTTYMHVSMCCVCVCVCVCVCTFEGELCGFGSDCISGAARGIDLCIAPALCAGINARKTLTKRAQIINYSKCWEIPSKMQHAAEHCKKLFPRKRGAGAGAGTGASGQRGWRSGQTR